jgi:RNA polymerase sigma-70 factor (ECF subfamily)
MAQPSTTDDPALVSAVLGNVPGAFEQLVRQYQGLVWHIVQRMVRHPDDTRELCQDTFLRVHQCLHQYRHDAPLKSWIGQVAYSVARRHLERKRIPLAETAEDDEGSCLLDRIGDGFDLEASTADAQQARRLHVAIDGLPPLQRTLLTLYHLEEMPIADIAAATGLAAGTIKSHLFRSRKLLRDALAPRIGVAA